MINCVQVNGFRTLTEFKLKLTRGLNLLVGANGGGKSTLMMFFSFLFDIYSVNLSTAISNIGGAGRIFRKKGATEYERIIQGEIHGTIKIDELDKSFLGFSDKDIEKVMPNGKFVYYAYKFEIELTEAREDVYFKSETFSIKQTNDSVKDTSRIKIWDVILEREVNFRGIKVYGLNNQRGKKIFQLPQYVSYKFDPKKEFGILEDAVGPMSSLLNITKYLGGFVRNALALDFGKRILYNPLPEQIRKSEDSAKSPGIRADGSGLYASLLSLKKRPPSNKIYHRLGTVSEVPFKPSVSFTQLIEYYKFAFPALHSLEVINDPFDNQIRARVTLDSKDGIQLPLSALSDGTLKWMSLVTALLSTRSVTGIEEPENFIHPSIQRQALNIIRENTNKNSFILVSTHSQSILDAALPEELIFITLKDSKTFAHRVKCPEKIKKLIYDSGFNLSFYYLSGVLQDA